MNSKIRNIIAIVVLVITLILAIIDAVFLVETIASYIRVSNTEGAEVYNHWEVAFGILFTYIFSIPIPVLSTASLLVAKDKRLKIVSLILLVFGIFLLIGCLIVSQII